MMELEDSDGEHEAAVRALSTQVRDRVSLALAEPFDTISVEAWLTVT
jgi:hypothetical protein